MKDNDDEDSDNDIEKLNNLPKFEGENSPKNYLSKNSQEKKNSEFFDRPGFDPNDNGQIENFDDSAQFLQNKVRNIPSTDETKNNIKKFIIVLSLSSILFIVQLILGAIYWKNYNSFFAKVFCLLGLLSLLIIIFAIIIIYLFYKKFLKFVDKWLKANTDLEILQSGNDYDTLMKSTEGSCVNLVMYLLMLLMTSYLIYIILAFHFKEINGEVNYVANNNIEFIKLYKNRTYREIIYYLKIMNIIYIIISLLAEGLFGYLLYIVFSILGFFDIFQKIIKYISMLYLQLSILFVYLSSYFLRLRNLSFLTNEFISWLPFALLVASIIQLLLAIAGYASSSKKNKLGLIATVVFSSLFLSFLLVMSFIAVKNTQAVGQFSEMECPTLQNFFHEKYILNFVDCYKYTEIKDNIEELNCPKERIVTFWEGRYEQKIDINNYQNGKYGCINISCCFKNQLNMQTLHEFLTLVCFTCIIFSLVFIGAIVYFINYIQEGNTYAIEEKRSQYFIYCFVGLTIIIFIIVFSVSKFPIYSPSFERDFKGSKANNSYILGNNFLPISTLEDTKDKLVTNKEVIYSKYIDKYTIIEENETCFINHLNCNELIYFMKINTDNYNINIDDIDIKKNSLKVKEILDENGYTSSLYVFGTSKLVKNIFSILNVNSGKKCKMDEKPIEINLFSLSVRNRKKVFNQENFFTYISDFISEGKNNGISMRIEKIHEKSDNKLITFDMEKLKENEIYFIYKEGYYFNLFDPTKMKRVFGYLVSTEDGTNFSPLKGETIEYYFNRFIDCKFNYIVTNEDGFFITDKFPVLKNNLFQEITFKVRKNKNHLETEKTFSLYGFEEDEKIYIGNFIVQEEVIKEFDKENEEENETNYLAFESYTVDSLKGEPLEGTVIDLYEGEVYFPNKKTDYKEIDYNEMNNEYLIKSVRSDKNGRFSFGNIANKKIYTLYLKNYGYYKSLETIFISENRNNSKYYLSYGLIPMLNINKDKNILIITLSWDKDPYDLNLFSFFKATEDFECQIYYGNRFCKKIKENSINYNDGNQGTQIISIEEIGNYIYTFAVNKFVIKDNPEKRGEIKAKGAENYAPIELFQKFMRNRSDSDDNKEISESQATIRIYANTYENEIFRINLRNRKEIFNGNEKWWVAFCLNGHMGIKSLKNINKLYSGKMTYKYCEDVYQQEREEK